MHESQAYTSKRRILIEVLPVPNAYRVLPNLVMYIFILPNPPFVVCSCMYAYMHEQITKGFGIMNTCISRFGIRIGDRKYPNEYTPFGSVSLCDVILLNSL